MKEIKLTQGQKAIVDDEDFDRLNKHKWCAWWNKGTKSYYAVRNTVLANGKRRLEYMHRVIHGLAYGDKRQVDHKDHNTLDNRKENLIITTHHKNNQNRINPSINGVGVYRRKGHNRKKPYKVDVMVNRKMCHIGYYSTKEEAQEARQKWLEQKGL